MHYKPCYGYHFQAQNKFHSPPPVLVFGFLLDSVQFVSYKIHMDLSFILFLVSCDPRDGFLVLRPTQEAIGFGVILLC